MYKRKNEKARRGIIASFLAGLGALVRGTVWLLLTPVRGMYKGISYLINGRVPAFEDDLMAEAWWRVRRRWRRRNLFNAHLYFFFAVQVMVILSALFYPFVRYGGYEMFVAAWLLLLGFHWLRIRSRNAEDDEMQALFEREYARINHRPQRPVYEEIDEYYGDQQNLRTPRRLADDYENYQDFHDMEPVPAQRKRQQ